MAIKHFILQSVVRTRRNYKRVRLLGRQISFEGIAMYGHGGLMSLQNAWKVLLDTLNTISFE
jgi:hypothetical protein